MIKDPWPLEWIPFPTLHTAEVRFSTQEYCRYSRRYNLPCATSRRKCRLCYMRQQGITDKTNIYERPKGTPKVVHICDRCGAEISSIDGIIYNEVTNRMGGLLSTAELCPACAAQLSEFLGGTDIQIVEIPDEDYNESFWD